MSGLRVEYTLGAWRELKGSYLWIKERSPQGAEKWRNDQARGLRKAYSPRSAGFPRLREPRFRSVLLLSFTPVGVRHAQEQMKMIIHQAKRQHLHPQQILVGTDGFQQKVLNFRI